MSERQDQGGGRRWVMLAGGAMLFFGGGLYLAATFMLPPGPAAALALPGGWMRLVSALLLTTAGLGALALGLARRKAPAPGDPRPGR